MDLPYWQNLDSQMDVKIHEKYDQKDLERSNHELEQYILE